MPEVSAIFQHNGPDFGGRQCFFNGLAGGRFARITLTSEHQYSVLQPREFGGQVEPLDSCPRQLVHLLMLYRCTSFVVRRKPEGRVREVSCEDRFPELLCPRCQIARDQPRSLQFRESLLDLPKACPDPVPCGRAAAHKHYRTYPLRMGYSVAQRYEATP